MHRFDVLFVMDLLLACCNKPSSISSLKAATALLNQHPRLGCLEDSWPQRIKSVQEANTQHCRALFQQHFIDLPGNPAQDAQGIADCGPNTLKLENLFREEGLPREQGKPERSVTHR